VLSCSLLLEEPHPCRAAVINGQAEMFPDMLGHVTGPHIKHDMCGTFPVSKAYLDQDSKVDRGPSREVIHEQ